MSEEIGLIDRLVHDIRQAGQVGRAPVEKATGASFRLASDDRYFRSWDAPPVSDGKLSFALDLREPKPGSAATGGAILVVKVAGGCASRAALAERYGGLHLSGTPRGRSPDEQAYWTRTEPWGELSFGFAESAPDCLRSVVFRAPDRS